jgi:hypothetical protein
LISDFVQQIAARAVSSRQPQLESSSPQGAFLQLESVLLYDSGYNQGGQAMTDKTAHIGAIVEIMLNTWDLPADCNEGELFTYAERLYDRIIAGDSKEDLYAYLSEVQVDHLEMAKSDAFRAIVDRAVERS